MDRVILKDATYEQPDNFVIIASYRSGMRTYEERFSLNTDLIDHVSFDIDRFEVNVKDSMRDIAKELYNIRQTLGQVVSKR